MEAVALHPGFFQVARQPKTPGGRRHRRMEGRIEAAHLRQPGTQRQQRLHRAEIVRLMQRRQRVQLFQCRQNSLIQAHGGGVTLAAMHDAVSDSGNVMAFAARRDPGKQLLQEILMGAAFPWLLHSPVAGRHACLELGLTADSGDAAAKPRLQFTIEQCKFQA